MPAQLVAETTFTVGDATQVEGPSPSEAYAVMFEDDGDTGYLYALDFAQADNPIVDALHIYNVEAVTDRDIPSRLQVAWSEDGVKVVLLINDQPHAVFDFGARRGYCRTGSAVPDPGSSGPGHAWDDAALAWFR